MKKKTSNQYFNPAISPYYLHNLLESFWNVIRCFKLLFEVANNCQMVSVCIHLSTVQKILACYKRLLQFVT